MTAARQSTRLRRARAASWPSRLSCAGTGGAKASRSSWSGGASPRDRLRHVHAGGTERDFGRAVRAVLSEQQDGAAAERRQQTDGAERPVRRVVLVLPRELTILVVDERVEPDGHAADEHSSAGPQIRFWNRLARCFALGGLRLVRGPSGRTQSDHE